MNYEVNRKYKIFTYSKQPASINCRIIVRINSFSFISPVPPVVNSSGKEQLQGEDFSRSIERGSRIISAVFNDTKVVLQVFHTVFYIQRKRLFQFIVKHSFCVSIQN